MKEWVKNLPSAEQVRWLMRAVESPDVVLRDELFAAFRRRRGRIATSPRRTVRRLLDRADELSSVREVEEAKRAARAAAATKARRAKRLDALAGRGSGAWDELARLIETRNYDAAVALAIDLRDLAARDGETSTFEERYAEIRRKLARRRGFFDRFRSAPGALG